MNKTELYGRINGRSAKYTNDYCSENYESENEALRVNIEKLVNKHNEKHDVKLSFKINTELNQIQVSNGQSFRFRIAPKQGTITVHSSYITVANVRIDKTDIDPTSICDDSFSTINGSKIKFL